jgi:hypothetical protein
MTSDTETQFTAAWDELLKALDGVAEVEASAFRLPNWPAHEYSAGEDGSISGIVYHLCAWKEAYAEGLETGAWGDEKGAVPEDASWSGQMQWLAEQHQRLRSALRRLEEDEATSILIDDRPYTLRDVFLDSMAHHDIYHAAQVNYLRQRFKAHKG